MHDELGLLRRAWDVLQASRSEAKGGRLAVDDQPELGVFEGIDPCDIVHVEAL